MDNFGAGATVEYRRAELVGTKFWSLWKADLILVPADPDELDLLLELHLDIGGDSSEAYPLQQLVWDLSALNQTRHVQRDHGRVLDVQQGIQRQLPVHRPWRRNDVGDRAAVAGTAILLFYGAVRGLNQALPHTLLLMFIGGVLGKFYFQETLWQEWRKHIPIIAAGFSCGMGLIAMLCIGVTVLSKRHSS